MNEGEIRKIVRDEMKQEAYQSGKPTILRHTHDGVNSPKLPISSITYAPEVLGKINFTRNSTYTLYFSHPNPSRIDLNGFVFNQSNDSTAMIIGIAILGAAKYFQPLSTSAAKEGGTQYPINGALAQCSSNFYVNQGASVDPFPHVDEFFIGNAFSGVGSHLVTVNLSNLTMSSIDVIITNLASSWTLSANFIIT